MRLLTLPISLLLVMMIATDAGFASNADVRIPFQVGEKLSYVLKWGIIPVGKSELQILDGSEELGQPAFLFRVTARSYPVIDLIYKVRDRIESYADRSMTHSLLYRKKQREGSYKKDSLTKFDWNQQKTHYYRKGKYKKTIDLLPGTFDPLAVFYAFRLFALKSKLEVEAPVTDGKKLVIGKARVIKQERVKVVAGKFDTFLIEPDLKHIGGIFRKSKDAKLQIWVTADDRRLVVKARSKVIVGHFTAELVSMEGVL